MNTEKQILFIAIYLIILNKQVKQASHLNEDSLHRYYVQRAFRINERENLKLQYKESIS